jgi:hypothetical protein
MPIYVSTDEPICAPIAPLLPLFVPFQESRHG